MIGQKSEQLTWGLAKYGRTEVQSSVNHFSNSVRAGLLWKKQVNFSLFLSCY